MTRLFYLLVANETEKDMVEMANEEKNKFMKILTEIDNELIDEVIAMKDDDHQEAMLFASELFTMYCNYICFHDWSHDILEEDTTGLGGIRSCCIVVRDTNAFQALKNEAGVHRVQRIPKTDKSGRIHTSTAVVLVIPCADEIDIKINPNDLRIETKRASGPGGQNVNKLLSAVRIVHIPSGTAVECQVIRNCTKPELTRNLCHLLYIQEERTQYQNKKIAMKKLHNLLYQAEFKKQASDELSVRKNQKGLRTRNEKLRTYNYSQNRITDHRVGGAVGTTHNLEEILLGKEYFHGFIHKINKAIKRQKIIEIIESKL